MANKGFADLKREVVDTGLCVSCGQCAGICPRQVVRMVYGEGDVEPVLDGECVPCNLCVATCPGHDIPYPRLEKLVFDRERKENEQRLGIWLASYRGHAKDPQLREKSSSGGVSSAVLAFALDTGLIDAAVFAALDEKAPYHARGTFASASRDYLARKVGSFYSPVATNAALWDAVMADHRDRVGLIGCGCHIQAVRKMQLGGKPTRLAKSVAFTIGLFCSSNYYFMGTEHLLVEFGGVPLDEVASIDYRGGAWPGNLVVSTRDGGAPQEIMSKHDYTWHFLCSAPYKRDRCMMCPDFGAELADLSVGDIYVPTEENPRWAVVLARTQRGADILRQAVDAGYVHVEDHSPELIPQSGVGWESQKHAAVFRLRQRKRFGWPTPDYHMELPIQYECRKKLYFK